MEFKIFFIHCACFVNADADWCNSINYVTQYSDFITIYMSEWS